MIRNSLKIAAFVVVMTGALVDRASAQDVVALDTSIRSASFQAASRSSERADWNNRLEDAQERRKRGLRLVLYGIGAAGAGTVVALTVAGSSDTVGGLRAGSAIAVISSLAGGGLATFGAFKWFSANGDIDDLDREGRAKGYLSIAPLPRGVYAGATFKF
jgi:hypothetical protein